MDYRVQFIVWTLLTICICVRFVTSLDVQLECDESQNGGVYPSVCTVTGLVLYPSQDVTVPSYFYVVGTLQFHNSVLYDVPKSIFDTSLTNLNRLHMKSSGIVKLSENSFKNAKSLNWLDLSYNKIRELNALVFHGAEYLTEIDLSNNQISVLSEHCFAGLPKIERINLEGNRIQHIQYGVFDEVRSLRFLNLAQNQLSNFYPNTFSDKLLSLNVSSNLFTNFSSFATVPNLSVLSASHNRLGKMRITSLAKLTRLETLELKNTSISGLTFGTFSNTHLRTLDLSDNNLQRINLDIFVPIISQYLEEFYLNGNNLSEIEGHGFGMFPGLRRLGLSRNNFNCSYLIDPIMISFAKHRISFDSSDRQMTDEDHHVYGVECSYTDEDAENN